MPSQDFRPSTEERIALRDRLRAARYMALADSEGFHEVCYAIEALGMCLSRKEGALGCYQKCIGNLAMRTPIFEYLPGTHPAFFTRFDALYKILRNARNDAMHTGSYARHATAVAVEICIGLEDALMNTGNIKETVADYMVKTPVCLEPWQPVAHARKLMLANSFSFLPILYEGEWKLVSELSVVSYLRPMGGDRRKCALAKSIADAANDDNGLRLLKASPIQTTQIVSELVASVSEVPNPTLWLVVDERNKLVGVLSPFELM